MIVPASMAKYYLLLAAVALPSLVAAGAGYHKWVDEEGNVHFSQKPPANYEAPIGEVEKGAVQYAPSNADAIEAHKAKVEQLDQQLKQRGEAKQKEHEQAKELAAKEEGCAKIRHQLDVLGTGRRLRTNQSGRVVPEEERQQRLQQLNARYQKDCS